MKKASCSERILAGLTARNLKQADLCSMTGISKSTMSQYISGKYEPGQIKTELISRALNVNEAWLMGFDVPMEREKPTFKNEDELWNSICNDETKLMLMKWISSLNEDQLQMVVKLLDAARLSPNE